MYVGIKLIKKCCYSLTPERSSGKLAANQEFFFMIFLYNNLFIVSLIKLCSCSTFLKHLPKPQQKFLSSTQPTQVKVCVHLWKLAPCSAGNEFVNSTFQVEVFFPTISWIPTQLHITIRNFKIFKFQVQDSINF